MVSGSELPFNKHVWTSLANMDKLNCYDYAFGNANPNQQEFSQPLVRDSPSYEYTCAAVESGMMRQHPETVISAFKDPCPSGKRKIALMVDSIGPSDYHFMRQDDDGVWSHKPGYLEPRRYDASGNLIVNPEMSNRNYEHFNYTNMCNYYCIPASVNSAM